MVWINKQLAGQTGGSLNSLVLVESIGVVGHVGFRVLMGKKASLLSARYYMSWIPPIRFLVSRKLDPHPSFGYCQPTEADGSRRT